MPPSVPPPASLGEFEVVLLMAVLHLTERQEPANGSAIRAEIEVRTRRPAPRGSIYVTLDRLEEKGLLTSRLQPDRGGRRPKRLFRVTPAGVRGVRQAVDTVVSMHRGLEPVLERS
ncbi:MAG: helix-turn-helix transcriptional regulator [Vicinamibacterales bacterium]